MFARAATRFANATKNAPVQVRFFSGYTNFATKFGADGKIEAHGGKICENMVDAAKGAELMRSVDGTIELNARQLCDTELIMGGGFSPLTGFMNPGDYDSVVEKSRLENGLLFGLPVVMDVTKARDDVKEGKKFGLLWNGQPVAVMDVESRWTPNKAVECKASYGTSSLEHPGVKMVAMERAEDYVGGAITGIQLPEREFPCATPNQLRATLPANGDVVAFQCRNPIHRAHYELFTRAAFAENVNQDNKVVLVHPTCGPTQADDIPGTVRYETYKVLKAQINDDENIRWAYLPYSMHMAGPREALQHMLIRKNYGCTHFIIGRDMAGSKSCIDGEDFYGAYDAQDLAISLSEELGVKTVPSLNLVYTEEKDYVTADEAKEQGFKPVKLSGTKFRKMLRGGEDIPEWFAFKSVVDVLRKHT